MNAYQMALHKNNQRAAAIIERVVMRADFGLSPTALEFLGEDKDEAH